MRVSVVVDFNLKYKSKFKKLMASQYLFNFNKKINQGYLNTSTNARCKHLFQSC